MKTLVRRTLRASTFAALAVNLAASLAGLAACARRERSAPPAAGREVSQVPEHFRLAVTRSGGFAGTATTATIDGDTRRYTLSASRPPGADSATGELPASVVRELARLVVDTLPGMRADYGTTPGAADMYEYLVEATWGSESRGLDAHTVRADDGTAPDALKEIIRRVFQTIDRARGPDGER